MRCLAFTHIGHLVKAEFSPDSQQLAAVFMESTAIHLWDLSSTPIRGESPGHKGYIRQLVHSADGRTLLSSDGDKFIKLWDLAERKEIGTLLGHREGVLGLAISADGRTVASGSGDGTLRLWNLPTRREVARFELECLA